MRTYNMLFLLGLLLLMSIASPIGDIDDRGEAFAFADEQCNTSYTEHGRIEIVNDTDFAYHASMEGWEGDGSSETPYVIEGYNITDDMTCIYIRDVSVYFTIRGCFINSSTTATDPGVYLYNASHARVEFTFITWHTYGIYANLCPDIVIDNCTVTRSNAFTIHIIDSDRAVLSDCGVYDNGYRIVIQSSTNVTILNSQIHDNGYEGISIEAGSHFATISGNAIYRNGFSMSFSGIAIVDSSNFTVVNNEIYENCYAGIDLYQTNNGVIRGNDLFNNSIYGVFGQDAYDVQVRDNDIWENGLEEPDSDHGGIALYTGNAWLIEGNRVWNNSIDGIYVGGNNNTIVGNEIFDNSETGIFACESHHNVISENLVHNNEYGVKIVNVGTNITDNTVFDNEFGIAVEVSGDCRIYGNDFGWNMLNAYENLTFAGQPLLWHDNVSIGNWWSDYDGTGPYGITNGTNFVSYDLYASKSLDLVAAAGHDFEFGSSGNVMVWPAQARNPSHYELYANNSLLYSHSWDGADIDVSLDDLPVGYHDMMLIAYHLSGHSINASSFAIVTDMTGPSWMAIPVNQEITAGESFSYQLSAFDPSGIGSYGVNDTVHFQISATGLITNASSLEVGVYGLEITVADIYGNQVTTIIRITVVAAPPSGGDNTLVIILSVGAAGVIIILVIVLFAKKQVK